MNPFTEREAIDTLIIIIEAMGSIMLLMIGGLSYFVIATAKMITKRNDKQDDRMDKLAEFMESQQDQINDIRNQVKSTIDLVKTNQENDSKNIQFMQQMLLGKLKLAKG